METIGKIPPTPTTANELPSTLFETAIATYLHVFVVRSNFSSKISDLYARTASRSVVGSSRFPKEKSVRMQS